MTTQRPIVELIDLLGKKWVMRIIWELKDDQCTFRELQSRCGDISPTIINRRIKELSGSRLVEKADSGYQLTKHGHELLELFTPINEFAQRWAERQ
ncbi:MAG: helix-turn-helix domain-containing protein [Pseudomonadota bacterium]|nr:helix-turn-helix domain-containing protein [Pseudomonadota bacterium]